MGKIDLVWNKVTEFSPENIEALRDNIHGVFRLSYQHKDGNIYVFYVGESENIKRDLLLLRNHSDNQCVESHIKTLKCYFRFAQVEQPELSRKVLEQLYKFYQPNCNEPITIINNDIEINVN